ncbi:armadillo repeat-containing protein 5-like [Centruroides sculpturatus]|uniref:armadillo repeat-containing protein 5-like n=1 Tax=Centruroides sculpturatus TaxID=218467 RepID=UPI000C6DE6BD|nr:armadillo repeat-containing protein 5-like [Centruroides sculpturatus]
MEGNNGSGGRTEAGTDEELLLEKLRSQSLTTLYNTLVYVRTKYLKRADGAKSLCKKGGIKLIVQLMEKPKLSDVALSILANCCLEAEVRKEVLKCNGITSLIRILRCLASETVQNRACRALSNLAIDSDCARCIHKLKAIPIIIKFLQSTKDVECQLTAVRALRILGNTPEHRIEIVQHEGIIPIVELLSSENNNLKKNSTRAIAWLTQNCSAECAQQVQGGQGLDELITLSNHSDNDVSEYALTSLINLTTQAAIRPSLGSSGVIPVFIKNIENNQNRKPGVTELVTALCLCCRDAVNRVRIRESNGLKTLLNLLNSAEREYLHERIIISLLAFRFDEPSLNVLLDNGFINSLVKHLNKYVIENKKYHILVPTKSDSLCSSKNKLDEEKFDEQYISSSMINEDKISQYNNEEIACKEVLQNDSETVNLCENVSRAPEITEECDSDFDNEVADATANMQKENNSTKVFCINSPSYQEIQNEQYEVTFGSECAFDNQLSDICSPCSTGSCFSPDRYSVDWSLPSPPPSYGVWSPAVSSRDDFQWSPNSFLSSPKRNTDFISISSPSSPSSSSSTSQSPQTVQLLRYSPVCEEHISEEENENCTETFASTKNQITESNLNVDRTQVTNLTTNKTESKQKSTVRTQSEKRDVSQLYPNNSNEEFIQPTLKLCENTKRRRISAASDISGHSSSHKEDRQNYNVGDYILMHLSHFSQMEKPTYKIVTEECIQALLDYACYVSTTARAERILSRLTSNFYCFEHLINFGTTLLIRNKLTIHDSSICDKCNHLKLLQSKLLKNLSFVAESGYGMGVLCHILLTGLDSEQSSCILAIPYLIRRRNLLKRILIDCYGLEILMNLLKTKSDVFEIAVNSLCALCQHFVRPFDVAHPSVGDEIRTKDHKATCRYAVDGDGYDVKFVLDDGGSVGARRSQLVQKSSFFQIMLQGSFAESAQESIKLPEVSERALEVIFHYLYDCKNMCFKLTSAATSVLLELMVVSDRLLLKELESRVVEEIVVRLSPENVWNVYLHSKKYNYVELNNAALAYILVGDMQSERRCRAVSSLFALEEAANHVETFIRDKFPESKDQPLYKRQKSNEGS